MGNPTKYDDAWAAIALLDEIYPKCFSQYEGRRRPLQIDIHKALQGAFLDDVLKKATRKRKLPAPPAQRDGLTALREAAKRRRVAA